MNYACTGRVGRNIRLKVSARPLWQTIVSPADLGHISGFMACRNKSRTATPIFEAKIFDGDNYWYVPPHLIPEINMAAVTMENNRVLNIVSAAFTYNWSRSCNQSELENQQTFNWNVWRYLDLSTAVMGSSQWRTPKRKYLNIAFNKE